MIKTIRWALVGLAFAPGLAYAAAPIIVGSADPCTYSQKTNVAVNVTSALTTLLVGSSGGKQTYICSVSLSIAGSGTTQAAAQFLMGQSTCSTSITYLSGLYGSGDAAVSAVPT